MQLFWFTKIRKKKMEKKKTLVIGASTNPERFSYKAIKLLRKYDHPVEALGLKEGEIEGVSIQKSKPEIIDIHTVTMYVGPKNQAEYYAYILNLKPKRIIFNPGTENDEFEQQAIQNGIEVIEDCTLVMLNSDRF
jgi:uncharacterized protein